LAFSRLYSNIQQLSPHSEAQRFLQSQALTMALDLGRTRVLLFELDPGSVLSGSGVLAQHHFRQLWVFALRCKPPLSSSKRFGAIY
jgi:hypothetical protein